jgi:hypothetical protein
MFGKVLRVFDVMVEHTGMTFKDFVYICILTALFALFAFVGHVRREPTELEGFFTFHYGYPLEYFEALYKEYTRWIPSYALVWGSVKITWVALILDFALYFLLAFTIVYVLERIFPAIQGK